MKQLLAVLVLASLLVTSAFAAGESKKECVTQKDSKTGKEKEVCKNIKVHKKLDVKEDKKK